jgi:hypothetical protein
VGKQNFWPNWNKIKLDRETLINAIANQTNHEGKPCAWTGVSVVTGPLSNGLMAVDFDGSAALQKYLELSAGELPPTTMKWTSGKAGHFQILLSVPPEKWEGLKPQKIELENGEKLELRWNQCSTLPPSIHPDTGEPYFWKYQGEIAECPEFILDLMRDAPPVELAKKPAAENPIYIDVEKSLVDILESEILPRLDAEEFYGSYTKLKSSGKNLKGLCPFHDEKTPSFSVTPQEKTFHCFGCGVGGGPVQFLHQIKGGSGSPIGKDFAQIVRELADKVGVSMPEYKLQAQNPKSNNQNSKVLTHPKFETPDAATLESEIENFFTLDLKRSQLQIRISELAKIYRLPSSDIWKIYREQEQEQEQEADRPDVATEIEALLRSHKSSVALAEILPVGLAQPIQKLATTLNLRSECYLAALLTQIASLLKVGTETILRRDTDWRCVPNYNAAIVSEVSQLKSPIPKAIIERPMRALRERAQKEFEQAEVNYESELNKWNAAKKEEDRGPAPKPPRLKTYVFDKTTAEGIIYQQAEFPDQAMMYFCDELVGIFKSANQYRGGKGSDEEDMLSFWNGKGTTVLRAAGVRASVEAVGLSIFGTIQPDVLADLLKDCSDGNGKFARFDFVFQPLAVPNLPEDDSGRFDLTPMLTDLYQRIDNLPAICFEFDREAKTYHRIFTLACHERRVYREPKQGLRGALGKMPEKVGKLATIIHALTCVFNEQQVTNQIPRSAVEAAARFVKFAADQVATLYTEFSDRTSLAPNLAKILLVAQRKGGTVTIRDAQLAFNSKFRPTAQVTKDWFGELVALGYGVIKKSGKSVIFQNTRGSDDQFLQSPSNPVPTRDTGADLGSIAVDQFLQSAKSIVGTDHQMRTDLIQAPPLQGTGSGSIVGTDPLFATSKKISTDEDVKKDNLDTESVQNFQKWGEQISENHKKLTELQKAFEEVVTVPTMEPQNQQALSFETVGAAPTVGDSSYNALNQDENELLEFLHKAVAEDNAYFAQQVRGILKEVCATGAADRKKVWAALSDQQQKKFAELLAVEISTEIGHILEAMQTILGSSDPNEIDHLDRVFARELIDQAIEFLGIDDKRKILRWIGIKDLAAALVEAIPDGPRAIYEAAASHFNGEEVEAAIARLEYLKEWDAVEKIRQALLAEPDNLALELAAAFCEPSRLREIAAANSVEAVERAIAEIEKGDRDMAEEIRDLLG